MNAPDLNELDQETTAVEPTQDSATTDQASEPSTGDEFVDRQGAIGGPIIVNK